MKLNKINRMYALSFIFTLHIAISVYVSSTFLTKIISEKYVGLLYTVSAIIALLLLSKSANILKYFGNRKLILSFLLINMTALAGLITSHHPYIIGLSFIAFNTTNTLIYLCLDIFVEHFGNPLKIGKNHSLYLMITNLAYMLSPLITALLITKDGGYTAIYIVAFIATVIMAIGMIFSVRDFADKVYKKTPFIETYRYLKTNKHMLSITVINFILQFFYAWMVVYMPIYLYEHIGFGWDKIGIIFTIMLVPFVIFGLPIGRLIDKYHIKKRIILLIGFLIISASTFSIFFIRTNDIALWALVLFMTRTGATLIETTSEIYFFTHIKEEDANLLGVFRDMNPVAYIIAPLIATLVFIFLPFNYLFIVLGLILLTGIYYVFQLKHNHENLIPNQNQ